ncbi:MAG: methionine--tRNA ligase, partial [Clostridia bacterium]|nr:methionine--tRNA ligase [Clostridia bacterium]
MKNICDKIYTENYSREVYSVKDKYYITTAIAYTSGKPHIGNTYEAILTDAMARFRRYQGYDVRFQTGTDEHGQKIEEKAKAAGTTPKQFVDQVAGQIKDIWEQVGVSYDKFIRTTDTYHEKQVQKIFKKLYEQGDIYKGSYEGNYCTPCESFWTDSQLVDGKCPDCGREVVKAKEEAYFFKMSKYADKLMQYYEEHPDFIVPVSRKNEMVNNFLKPGLQDLCVSRSTFKWGIPVDFDDRHVVYVWLDALTNYITGLGYDVEGNHDKLYNEYWQNTTHVIGKDIIRFHTIYWPIFLMALGLPLPKQVYGHGWLLQEGDKMSKSKGNVIYADDLVKFFGKDAVRYYVLTAMPVDNDGLISYQMVIDAVNSDLANVFGNLVSRTIAMSNKYFGGVVENKGVAEEVDADLIKVVTSTKAKVLAKMDEWKVSDAISEIISLFRRANKYIDETMPWALAKDSEKQDRLATVLYNLTESIVIGASLLVPFMPDSCAKTIEMMGATLRAFDDADKFGLLGKVKVTETPEMLFARIDAKVLLAEVDKMVEERKQKANAEAQKEQKPAKAQIEFEDFSKVELKVAL